ncbi:MAG: toprim domain-containing protein [Thermoplasmata archaeon]|nr:toprim domain-containing protein [Thermoplasmata archaeon]
MLEAKKLELLERYIEELIEENLTQPIVVEGDTDKCALRELGVAGEILVLNTGTSLPAFVENTARTHRSVILLLDWDRKGFSLTLQLSKLFLANDVSVDLTYWKRFKDIVSKDVKDVESLPSVVKRIAEKTIKNCV